MADLQALSVTALGSASVNVPRATISALVTDSQTGAILADFTGANAIAFPAVLAQLTAAQRRDLIDLVVPWLVRTRAGLET